MVVLCIKLIVCENETVTLVSNETTTTEAITSTSIPNTETTIANKDVIEPEVHPEVKAEVNEEHSKIIYFVINFVLFLCIESK